MEEEEIKKEEIAPEVEVIPLQTEVVSKDYIEYTKTEKKLVKREDIESDIEILEVQVAEILAEIEEKKGLLKSLDEFK